ncbi:MAG: helix-turn-helix transcriptional regulator [Sebaldella sp.]|nr:helix-turn-helix transcriptional regulator [Sebaldella sp.]
MDRTYNCSSDQNYTCPVELTQKIISKKWSAIILWRLRLGKQRLRDFKNDIKGCNEKMLIQHLNLLLKEDFIKKIEYDVYPKKTEYSLTEKGKELLPILTLMQEYGKKYLE